MSLFKKKKPELIDYSLMQKHGFIPAQVAQKDIIDLRKENSTESNSSGFDFLGSLAGAGASSINDSPGPLTESLREARKKSGFNAEINQLKVQIDNHDFKIDNLHNKIIELEKKLREKGI